MSHTNRLRAAIGSALIALASRIMPPAPLLDHETRERIRARFLYRSGLLALGDHRNGNHRPPASPL